MSERFSGPSDCTRPAGQLAASAIQPRVMSCDQTVMLVITVPPFRMSCVGVASATTSVSMREHGHGTGPPAIESKASTRSERLSVRLRFIKTSSITNCRKERHTEITKGRKIYRKKERIERQSEPKKTKESKTQETTV